MALHLLLAICYLQISELQFKLDLTGLSLEVPYQQRPGQ